MTSCNFCGMISLEGKIEFVGVVIMVKIEWYIPPICMECTNGCKKHLNKEIFQSAFEKKKAVLYCKRYVKLKIKGDAKMV